MRRVCPQLKQGIMKAGAADYRSRSPPRKVTFQTQEPEVPKEETAKDGNQNTEPKVCGACLILTDVVNYSQATTNEREMVKTSVGSPIKVSSVSSLSEMSTVQGFVGEKPVDVLRDTGCSGVIVSKDLVPEKAYTGRSHTMVMVDYSSRVVPEVKVSVDTPYYKGEVLALCVEKPLVGLIIGNIPGARERNNPDINWVPALAVQTRAQAKREGVTSKLKTPSIIDITINPEQVSNAQKDPLSSLPIFKFSETVIQIMWTYVVMRDVVEGVSLISEVPDSWLRPGKRKFTVGLNSSIANHGKAIWRYVLLKKESQRDQRLV